MLTTLGEESNRVHLVRRGHKTQALLNIWMSKLPIENATIKIKRKRAPIWPFATRNLCERVIELLIKDDLVRELFPPDEWRIHPSTEAR